MQVLCLIQQLLHLKNALSCLMEYKCNLGAFPIRKRVSLSCRLLNPPAFWHAPLRDCLICYILRVHS